MTLADFDINTLLNGATGFAAATIIIGSGVGVVLIRFILPAWERVQSADRAEMKAMSDAMSKLTDSINQLVTHDRLNLDARLESLLEAVKKK